MAVTTVETIIANPARKRSGKRKAKGPMTAKQIKFFGTKRQKAALKANRSRKRKTNPARKQHKAAPRKQAHRKRSAPRKNPGEIISLVLGNPARRKKAVAHTKKRKTASARRTTNAGRRTTKKNNPAKMHHRRRTHRSNPAGMGVTDLVALGGGAMLGGAVPTVISQAVLKEKNTGLMGYAANIAATFLLAWGAAKVAKGQLGASFAKGILAGGIGSVIKRAITDYSLLGQYGQTLGLGDYMVANFTNPPRVADGLNSPMYQIPDGWAPTTVIQSSAPGMGCYGGGPLYG